MVEVLKMRITVKRRLLISNILMLGIPILLTIGMLIGLNYVFYSITGIDTSTLRHGGITTVQEGTSAHWTQHTMFILILIPFTFIFITNYVLKKLVFNPIMTSVNILATGVKELSDGNLTYRIKHDKGNEFDSVCSDFNTMAARLLDMVEQKQADEKNRKELIAGISHDLRTPLTSIKTYVEGIELGMAETPEKQKKYLTTIKDKTDDIEHIINQLFLFSKLDIGEFPMRIEQKDAGRWIVDFISSVSEEYTQKGLRVELAVNIQDTFFSVDSVQLRTVFINILENSVVHGNKDDGIMNIGCTKGSEYITITMTDNGPGVPNDDLAMIFDVFYRADKARRNTSQSSGLGLAISAKIIERLGGEIIAANEPYKGLSIQVILPIAKMEQQE
jgi:signal transduction histidine kinase